MIWSEYKILFKETCILSTVLAPLFAHEVIPWALKYTYKNKDTPGVVVGSLLAERGWRALGSAGHGIGIAIWHMGPGHQSIQTNNVKFIDLSIWI